MNKILIFDISKFLEVTTGTSERFSFQGHTVFDEITTSSEISGQIEIMRIEDGLNVKVNNLEIEVEFSCEKCLKPYPHKIKIDCAERVFLFKTPTEIEDINDLFLVDLKKMQIDLSDLLRQEIILHFPSVRVCSKGCKGLCPHCGVNRNEKKCDCKEETPDSNKPLSILKDLLNRER